MNAYVVDRLNSEISFTIKFFNTHIKGVFESFNTTLSVDTIEQLPSSQIDVEIDVASLNTFEPLRDQHLISADFFYADKFPKVIFHKTEIDELQPDHYRLFGDLTIKNITKPVMFEVQHIREQASRDLNSLMFKCNASINRVEYGLTTNKILEKMNTIDEKVIVAITFIVHPK